MLITPIWPNVSVSPSAASNRIAPVAVPVSSGVVRTFMLLLSEAVGEGARELRAPSPTETVRTRGSPCVGVEPGVRLEERVGLDRAVRLVDDVELVLGVDLADQRRL